MEILLSAYGCSPVMGSEPGVGWRWAVELSKNHKVTVLTHPFFKESIDEYLLENKLDIKFIYFEPKWFGIRREKGSLNSRVYYFIWHLLAFFYIKKNVDITSIDLIHHISWGTFRYPSFLPFLNKPFVFGPVGGGEMPPLNILTNFSRKEKLKEYVRYFIIKSAYLDPILYFSLSKTSLILCKTDETIKALPYGLSKKAVRAQEIGTNLVGDICINKNNRESFEVFFAGRLVEWKGISLALEAMIKVINENNNINFYIAGDGPLREIIAKEIIDNDLGGNIFLLGSVDRVKLFELYKDMDLFLFPSFHDSSGNVIVESMSYGLPIICLDLGGPSTFVDESFSRVISTKNITWDSLVNEVCSAVNYYYALDVESLNATKVQAIKKSKLISWELQVNLAYKIINDRVFINAD